MCVCECMYVCVCVLFFYFSLCVFVLRVVVGVRVCVCVVVVMCVFSLFFYVMGVRACVLYQHKSQYVQHTNHIILFTYNKFAILL